MHTHRYVDKFPSHALAGIIAQDLNNQSQLIRAVIWHNRALKLFKKIHSYTVIRITINLTITLVCVL